MRIQMLKRLYSRWQYKRLKRRLKDTPYKLDVFTTYYAFCASLSLHNTEYRCRRRFYVSTHSGNIYRFRRVVYNVEQLLAYRSHDIDGFSSRHEPLKQVSLNDYLTDDSNFPIYEEDIPEFIFEHIRRLHDRLISIRNESPYLNDHYETAMSYVLIEAISFLRAVIESQLEIGDE